MKKLIRSFCSAFCVMSITVPLNALATPSEVVVDINDEQIEQSSDTEQLDNEYHLAFLTGDFGLQTADKVAKRPIDTMMLFISDQDGKMVKDAQVVHTVINQEGLQKMSRSRIYKGGYTVAINHLPTGKYRLESEIITGGQLLTNEFDFYKA